MDATKIHENSQPGLIGRVWAWVTGNPSSAPISPPETGRLVEAAGATVDQDEDHWRPLTGNGQRDLSPLTQDRMQRLAHYQWETNLLANRLIELPVAYLLAGGVRLTVQDDDAQDALDAFWDDGINAWDLKLTKRVRELALFGEQCYPVFRNELNGFVRLGYLDPKLIGTVVTDPDNLEQPIGIVTKKDKRGVAKRYRVIVNVPETAFTARTQEIRSTFVDGDCFYYRVNDLSSATRGRSDLLAQIDWLDAYDQYLFGELDRASFLRAFVWDVTLKGASPAEVEERARKITAPAPGSVRVHNDSEAWDAKSPELQANDAAEGARLFRNHILGGATQPEHWYGGGGDVNRSTGESMAEPTEKMLAMRQSLIGYILADIGRYVVRSVWQVLEEDPSAEQLKILGSVKAAWPEITSKDITKYAAAIVQVTTAAATLIAEGLITRETALRLVQALANRLGVEIDAAQELAAAQKELGDNGGPELGGLRLRNQPPAPVPPVPADDAA
ncbi:hypothetical protein KR767_04120 [Luteibacter anthropi]|uniref:hypothetical protein n=1 Tax=Luteibacter anthropi TaxID=564369 RepID=UPI00203259F1|nr:hypothetical protein [Luteibacter anthropi]URX63263.1 hypothetical protein KR767_04120 [Luteibacter anthropi]